jgi:hypothetical protein
VPNRSPKIMTIRKIQFWLETSYMVLVAALIVLYLALAVRAAFFPNHCAALIGFSVCLNG